ncbi:hypothetical protein BV25DRAFT_1842879 [Artomyces pyxidatus]|uniref:Uncharacterized protein n=1 Tax=Artomyces pyxidatus TaxID=48021 RepID=A0ACB8SH55_9AGAM|nr:hypothetical protein BV25DRAFT_1842879 [Artomyces pyxidatus]
MADTTPTSPTLAPVGDPAGPVTFIFLSDPQQTRTETADFRRKGCSDLNAALNTLDSLKWPTGSEFPISCAGEPIGKVDAVFVGGDLCQTGGDQNAEDQLLHAPSTYVGGLRELAKVRGLYQKGFDVNEDVTPLKYDPKFFGLGDHDIQTEDTPAIGWNKGRFPGDLTEPQDYWRYQMWNFISQMHSGYDHAPLMPYTRPVYGIEGNNLDTELYKGSYSWQEYSLNYVVNLGPVDVIQLHRYGGDSEGGRQSGFNWLKQRLAERGLTRPIIIMQHYMLSDVVEDGSGVTPNWHRSQRNELLDILSPYNIIGFFVGNNLGVGRLPYEINVPNKDPTFPTRVVPEFRPGCAWAQNFALVRVTSWTMDVVYGFAQDRKAVFTSGASFKIPYMHQIWEEALAWNSSYFGTLRNFSVSALRAKCTADKVVISCGLRRTTHPEPDDRVAWEIVAAKVDGSQRETIRAPTTLTSSHFPSSGGMTKLYADTAPVLCPAHCAVAGVFFWQKDSRVAPGLVVREVTTKKEYEVRNQSLGPGEYFPPEHGCTDMYADTNMVSRPSGKAGVPDTLQMGGVALYQKGDRIGVRVLYV